MTWYVNDLSLHGQFESPQAFLNVLSELLRIRQQNPTINSRLFCSRALHTQSVVGVTNLRQVVQEYGDKNLKRLVLDWLTSKGPFWDDVRNQNADDYFEFSGVDVTNQGLGEAARSLLNSKIAGTFSFSPSKFQYFPLEVQQGLQEAPISTVDVPNQWTIQQLHNEAIESEPIPQNWQQAIEQAKVRFDKIIFSNEIANQLSGESFSHYVVERVFELLSILQKFVASRNDDGTYSSRTQELITDYFSGGKALFSDESISNKRNFEKKMLFTDPNDENLQISCPWHGKIKTPQFRVHFAWPLLSNEERVKVVYIGPKITKE